MRSRQLGFSLLELMITVAIVVIIAGIAYPSYQNHIRKATRADAKAALIDAAARQERYFVENDTYTASMSDLGLDPAQSPEGYYAISASAGPSGSLASSYTISASITSAGSDPDCTSFTYSSNGAKSASSSNCWD